MRIWLKKIREENSLTHNNVAVMTGISRAYYTQIETGARNPRVETAKKIATVLNFDWTIFFNDNSNITTLKNTG